jgi:1-phosphatidylinositol phosphodiesterase
VIDVRLAAVPVVPKAGGASPETLPSPQYKLIAYHGIYPQRTPFTTVLSSLHTYLTSPAGARETIVMSIKQEDFTITPPTTFSRLVREEIMNSPGGFKNTNEKGERDLGMWYLQNRVPTLGEVRGKVVLLSRFGVNGEEWEGGWEGLGIHPLHWPDSEKKGFVWNLKGTPIRTHDWYAIPSFLAIPEKTMLSTLVLKPTVPFPLNFPLALEPSSNGGEGGSSGSAPVYGPETLNIAYLSAATFPLALPPTVAMGCGFPGWKMGFEGVNARTGRWLLEELVPELKSFSPIKSAAAPKSPENGYGAVKQSSSQDKQGVLMEESADEKRAARLRWLRPQIKRNESRSHLLRPTELEDGQAQAPLASPTRLRGWVLLDFYSSEKDLLPLLVEFNWQGRKSGEEGWP